MRMRRAALVLLVALLLTGTSTSPVSAQTGNARIPVTPIYTSPRTRVVLRPVAIKAVRLPVVFKNVSTRKKIVALTFDDGPVGNAQVVCNILKAWHSKATFFYIGNRRMDLTGEYKIALTCGEIGNHSSNHLVMPGMPLAKQENEITWTNAVIKKKTGTTAHWFRPRAGLYDNNTLLATRMAGMRMVLWDADGDDTFEAHQSRYGISYRVLRTVHPGAIILLHQTNPESIKALPMILSGLRAQGYVITTVSDLLASQ